MFCGSRKYRTVLKRQDFAILSCKECQIAKTQPPPTLPDYEEMDFHFRENEVEFIQPKDLPEDWQRSISIQEKMITDHLPKGSKITEIGCGEGLFLNELQKHGFRTFGIEPSVSAAKRGATRGIGINRGYFPVVKPDELQDLFILSHVLEHIEEPVSFIDAISEKLKPGGYILLAQTNYRGFIPRLQKEKWYAWVPEHHYWHFTLNGLTTLMEKKKFKRKDYKYSSLVHKHDLQYKIAEWKESWIDQFIVLFKKEE